MRRKLAPLLAAAVSLATVAWVLLSDRETYELRWKFRAGDVLRYRTVQIMGTPGNESCHVTFDSFTVDQVFADGSAEITTLLQRTTIRERDPEGPIIWDSDAGEPPPKDLSIAMAAAMTGVPVRLRVDTRGLVLSTEGKEVIQERVRKNLGGDIFGAFSELPFSVTGETFHGVPLPAIPVSRGRRWRQDSGFGTQTWGKTSVLEEYEFQEVRDGHAIIVLSRTVMKQNPGEVQKALGQQPPDPNEDKGSETVATFSIQEGKLVSQRGRTWTQASLSNGKLFRFESRTETELLR